MSELHEDLDRAVSAFDAGSPPVGRVLRDGHRLRRRWLATVAAGVAAVIAVAVGVPSLARQSAAPAAVPVTKTHDPVITDLPVVGGGLPGVIVAGTVGATWWEAIVSAQSPVPSGDGTLPVCLSGELSPEGAPASGASGSAVSSSEALSAGCGVAVPSAADPAIFESTGSGTIAIEISAVASDVTYFEVRFADGQQLTLTPVTWHGNRYVAFPDPVSMPVASVTAYLAGPSHADGQTLTAIPFSQGSAGPVFGLWLRPGQAGPPRASGTVAAGTLDGLAWSVKAYEGPWGTCLVSDVTPGSGTGSACVPETALDTNAILGGGGTTANAVYGSAAAGVAVMKITLSTGQILSAAPVTIGTDRLFAVAAGPKVSAVRWAAYSASGALLASGKGL